MKKPVYGMITSITAICGIAGVAIVAAIMMMLTAQQVTDKN